MRRKGEGSGSSPQVSGSASVAVALEYHHRGSFRASAGEPESEVLMGGKHDVRKIDLRVDFAVWLRNLVLAAATAAFVILGYGDGFPPFA